MFVLVFFSSLFADSVQTDTASAWPYQHVDKQSRLSNSAITSVYMDQYDQVWLGTWDGLNRYDGSSIKVYMPNSFVKGAISNNVVRNFLEDGFGRLWVITHQGINKYKRSTDSFQSYLESPIDIPFSENNIHACIGPDSTIYASLIGKGVSRYSEKEDAFLNFVMEGVSQPWLSTVIDLIYHNKLLFLLGTDGKLICATDNRVVYSKQLKGIKDFRYHKFVTISNRNFLAITDPLGQLLLFDLSEIDQEPYVIKLGGTILSSLSENQTKTSLWIGTESGDMFQFQLKGSSIHLQKMNDYFPIFSKSKVKILSITETKQDLIWVGTDGDGVYKFLTRPKVFFSVQAGPPENKQLSHAIVRSVFENKAWTLYVGTRGGGLNIIDAKKKKTETINTSNGLSNDAVLSINQDRFGNQWIGVDGEGIDMIESSTHRVFHFPRDFEKPSGLAFGAVYSICMDAFHDIWLGTSGYGVIRMKVSKSSSGKYQLKEFDQISYTGRTDQLSIKSNIVYSIVEERPNILWFGTRGGGIYRFNGLTKKIEESIQANPSNKSSISNNDVLSMHIDSHEQLWVGTSGGLNRVHLSVKPYRIDHFTQREGLPNNTIHGIQQDAMESIWISTNRGLVRYSEKENKFKSFDTNDGLVNNEFTDGATFQSTISERLYFGGIDGLDIVHPSKLNSIYYFPRLLLSDFQVRNVSVTSENQSNILTDAVDFTKSIQLKHNQNFISFYFTSLDYWNKGKEQYAYYLENFDKDWNYIGSQKSITFTNIPPGEYQLLIKATNENGVWNPTPRSIRITVQPPFYQTAWAYAIYVLLALAVQVAVILYIRWRGKQNRLSAIEKLKAVQLKELNDHKLQFFTNIAHEFRTPLTLILGPVVSLLTRNKDTNNTKLLNGIYINSLRLQKLIEELIQFRKIELGKDELHISKLDAVRFAQKIVESFQQHASERDIHVEFYPQEENLITNLDVSKVEKILINLISNAIKYSTVGGVVSISIAQRSGQTIFQIKDDGIGIAEENKDKIFESFYQNTTQSVDTNGLAKSTGIGLSLTKSLVVMHQGEISFFSKKGKGSTFTVALPIDHPCYYENQLSISPIIPLSNLTERISLEFEANQQAGNPHENTNHPTAVKHHYSILLVDDNEQITELLDNILSDRYTIYKSANGKQALAILEAERIDLVVSDILMPDMDGLTLCKAIKQNIQTSHIAVILLTAKAEIENRIEGLQVGADSYIPKPFHPEHLFVRIEKLLENLESSKARFRNLAAAEQLPFSNGTNDLEDKFFLKISACINKNLSDTEFNADTIAQDVGMSKASLYKKVKTISGLTPHGLIKQYRLKRAAYLLQNTDMNVSEVIDEIGFNSRSYFYKSFNEMFHCHPKDYPSNPQAHTNVV